jgi:hypothetical protein
MGDKTDNRPHATLQTTRAAMSQTEWRQEPALIATTRSLARSAYFGDTIPRPHRVYLGGETGWTAKNAPPVWPRPHLACQGGEGAWIADPRTASFTNPDKPGGVEVVEARPALAGQPDSPPRQAGRGSICNLQFVIYNLQPVFCILHFAFCILPFSFSRPAPRATL